MNFAQVLSLLTEVRPGRRGAWRCVAGASVLGLVLWTTAGSDSAHAVDVVPTPKLKLPARAVKLESFAPEGWALERKIMGDLNGDGVEDAVLILHGTDTDNIILNATGGSSDALDTNPRVIVGLTAGEDGKGKTYSLAFQATDLIPRRDSPNLDEPLGEVTIEDGVLVVGLHFWTSSGAWPGSETTFRLKLEPECLSMVGYENVETQRVSKETDGVSINYLEGYVETIKSKGAGKSGFKVQRSRLEKKPLVCVDDIGNGWDYDPKVTTDNPEAKASHPPEPRVH